MTQSKSREATAYARAQILAPLLNRDLDRASRARTLKRVSQEHGVSERTLRRWLAAYEQDGFDGLLPAQRDLSALRVIPESIVDMAVTLRREVPERSVADIIRLLEYEGYIEEGSVKRSTLQDQLYRRGYGTRQLAMYRSAGVGAARRFEHRDRNGLWQADIKYLLVLPATSKTPARQLYVSAFIDDATRMVTGIRVYDRQDVHCVLDCFRHAMENYGVPDRLFTDNGRVYIGRQLKQTCAKLAISLLHARPYAAQAKGKIEAFNKTLEKFVVEEKLERPSSVEQVQHDLDCWMESFYYDVPHSALNGKTPRQAFRENRKIQRFVSADELNRAFRATESRLVDKTGCLSFAGRKWEAGPEYIGFKVDGKAINFATLKPQSASMLLEIALPKTDETDALITGQGLETLTYDKTFSRYRIRLTQAELTKHQNFIFDLLKLAYERRMAS